MQFYEFFYNKLNMYVRFTMSVCPVQRLLDPAEEENTIPPNGGTSRPTAYRNIKKT
jgi:hypothetical protein